MLVSNPPVNSHQLNNSLTGSNTLHSSLPTSFSTSSLAPLTTTNPSIWTLKQVEEWLVKNDLQDCIDLICVQHRMNGQRLMNLKEQDVLQLKGTNKNQELWTQIKKLQQFYSSNYNLWSQRTSAPQQTSLPMTASSYFAPSPTQAPIPLRPIRLLTPIRPPSTPPTPTATVLPTSPNAVPQQSQSSLTSSTSTSSSLTSSHTTLNLPENQNESNLRPTSSLNPTAQSTTTTLQLERSPLTNTRSTSTQQPQHHRRSLSHSLSTSNTSINILPMSTSRATNSLIHHHRTPAEQIEDQPVTSCCFVGSMRTDRKKTLAACLLALCTVYFCSFIITIVDERLPDPANFPPLPDLVLDNIKQIPWAFSVTEKIIVIEMVTLITIVVLHRHRLIILRRFFAIAAALYFLRSLTMVFTSLPVATAVTDCRPERLISFAARFKKATLIFIGQGMSSFGVKTCGDYLYSGHTCTLILATHFINEYSPRSYHLLHFLSWIMAITGMFFILAGHQHYSIDILVAWVLSSRLFIYYHTLANNRTYFQRDKTRMRIWFPFFSYFEENVKQAIPNEYCFTDIIYEVRAKFAGCFDKVRYPTD